MRWNPIADQMLLLKLIETHEISIDTGKIADSWPADLSGEAPPTARAIKERISKIRDLIKQAAGTGSISALAGKRNRVKKNTASKTAAGSKAPARPRKTKRQTAAAVEPEQETHDTADHNAEMNDLLDYPTQAPDAKLTDILKNPAEAPDAEMFPSIHDNPDEFDEEE